MNEDQREILQYPPNHRVFPKLNLEDFRTELEKCVIKANWEKMGDKTKNEEENRKLENDDTFSAAPVTRSKVIDFRELNATEEIMSRKN